MTKNEIAAIVVRNVNDKDFRVNPSRESKDYRPSFTMALAMVDMVARA